MKEITRFINDELKPRLYDHVPEILPDLHFVKSRKGDKWISPLHYDKSEPTHKAADKCFVSEKYPATVYDNGKQEAHDIIALFMKFEGLEIWEAVKKLCEIVGIPQPEQKELTTEQKEIYAAVESKRKILEESIRRQALALYQPKDNRAAEVKDYIYKRGFKNWDLFEKMMEGRGLLGYISEEEATALQSEGILLPSGVGTAFTLSIPVYSGSTLCGIKFRNPKAPKGMQRYTSYSLYGGGKNLYNLPDIRQKNGTVVVVESELDVLIAEYNGLRGFVATGGGGLTGEMMAAVQARGIKRITLLLDADERGTEFVRDSIKTAHKKGISVLVATIPGGERLPDGTAVHDVGEYLQIHTKEELQTLIDNAIVGSMWRLNDLVTSYKDGKETLTDAEDIDLRNEVIALANDTPNEIERDRILTLYAETYGVARKEAMRAAADRERERQETKRRDEETRKAIEEATALSAQGRTQAALKVMEEAIAKAKQIEYQAKYGDLLHIPTREERIKRFQERPGCLETSYCFGLRGEDPQPLTIPSGAVTIIGAMTNHGKSLFLRNLAIDIAKRYADDKKVLYFTFEECEEDVWAQFANTYVNLQLHEVSHKYDQTETIAEYYKTGETTYIKDCVKDEFIRREKEFSEGFLDSGKISIFYKDYNLETLIEALEYAVGNIPTKAIFIDYIQILRSQKASKLPRAEQLKEICTSIKDFAVSKKLPIVMAAQLNRSVENIFKMDNQNMAEGSDIEKSAHTIVMAYSSKKKVDVSGLNKDEKKMFEELEENGFKNGEGGQLYIKLTKRRGRGVGRCAVLTHIDYTGKLVENYDPDRQELQNQGSKSRKHGAVLPF